MGSAAVADMAVAAVTRAGTRVVMAAASVVAVTLAAASAVTVADLWAVSVEAAAVPWRLRRLPGGFRGGYYRGYPFYGSVSTLDSAATRLLRLPGLRVLGTIRMLTYDPCLQWGLLHSARPQQDYGYQQSNPPQPQTRAGWTSASAWQPQCASNNLHHLRRLSRSRPMKATNLSSI
jgi:hypothetical protein